MGTIWVSDEIEGELEDRKSDGQSFTDVVKKLLDLDGGDYPTRDEVEKLVERKIEEALGDRY